ncbi:hypothetical protein TCAL_07724 [Tigriopus californicus]|uniref:Ionotropic glutamate receptor C-terminal domain-containing protein n=1 Tax=Tigriopus californicus TaxID=6832 RepID=A0A553PJU5_TIGCA|nr:ionotropic receptor 25a-like [Tigriopus californicus]TRY77929.1 hypothetical protein TCAL_07724 [Tigriopus californicus]|eukprot:TCALIF_07724-PA protein Name:"Similar to Grik2 Glutamate receptor ionotropic, kainate 2 (Mus musculus)" AED:0.01 eAED:0.01 QI:0/-1/0/1/-1/1/1/0/900
MWAHAVTCGLWVLVTLNLGLVQRQKILWVNDMRNKIADESVDRIFDDNKGTGLEEAELIKVDIGEDPTESVTNICNALEGEVGETISAIYDTTYGGKSTEALKSLALSMGIPMLSFNFLKYGEWGELSDNQMKYLITVNPPGHTLVRAIRNIAEEGNVTNAAIVFDETFDMYNQYGTLLLNVPTRHLIQPMKKTMDEMKRQLTFFDEIDLHNIFLVGSAENIKLYMAAANSMDMFGIKYSWFAVSKDPYIANCDCSEVTLLSVNPEVLESEKSLSSALDTSTLPPTDVGFYHATMKALLQAVSALTTEGKLPVTLEQTCATFSNENPTDRDIDLMGAMSAAISAGSPSSLMIMDGKPQYNVNVVLRRLEMKSKKLVLVSDIGMSSPNEVINYKTGKALGSVAATTVLRVVVVHQPPFVERVGDGEFIGYCIDLINELKQLMGFEFELYEAPDAKYGRMDEEMNWNGMVKELVDKKADVALGALSVMAERENVIDFTVPYYDLVGITILMKKPKVPTSLFKFLSVLEDSVWGCILLAYFVTSLLMWLFDKFSPYSYQNNMEKYEDDDEKRYFNLKECLWFCMTSLTPQGGGEAPKNLSGRLVAATWWLFGFIIIASYTANLAAFLTVSRLETPVESLEDLSKQYKIKYSPMNGSATMTYFERMAYIENKFYEIWKDMSLNDSLSELERSKLAVWDYPVSDKYTKMWQSMQEAGLPQSFDQALEWVRDSPSSSEGYAFLGDATDIRYQVLTNCDLQMVGEEFSRKPYALAVQQGSPLKDQFNDAILKLLNQRKLETLKERWWNQNPKKKVCDDDDDSSGGISIYNIGGVFIVIFVGIGLAIITLIFEYWYYKNKKPVSPTGSQTKKLEVKQALRDVNFGNKSDYETEYKNSGGGIAPIGNPW